MTPDDHRMIEDLFQRLSAQGRVAKDPQADRVIADLFRANPNASYLLVQTTLVYEHQLSEQEARIQELEAQLAQGQQGAPAYGGGSFLGGRVGQNRGSVPPVAAAPSPWSQPQAAPRAGYAPAPQSPFAATPPAAPAAPGFFRSALQTAAGVAGGMVFANAIGSMFGGHEAHATPFGTGESAALRDADATQDALQDELDAQDAADDSAGDASYDDGIDT